MNFFIHRHVSILTNYGRSSFPTPGAVLPAVLSYYYRPGYDLAIVKYYIFHTNNFPNKFLYHWVIGCTQITDYCS